MENPLNTKASQETRGTQESFASLIDYDAIDTPAGETLAKSGANTVCDLCYQ